MARYDWPRPRRRKDRAALRSHHFQRLWGGVASDLMKEASEAFRAQLASSFTGLSTAQIDAKRWLPIGPSVILKGQARDQPRVAGRVRDIKRSPDGTRLYAASANGGIWFSGDAGHSWAPLGGMAIPGVSTAPVAASSLAIGCLHVDFGADKDSDTVHAGTGEPYFEYELSGIPGNSNAGIGILRLTGSVTDSLADPAFNPWTREAPELTGAGIFRIVADPAQPGALVAATTQGLFSRPAPSTAIPQPPWTRVAITPAATQVFATDAAWVAAGASGLLFVALVNFGPTGPQSAVYVSNGGPGGTFVKIPLGGYVARRRITLAAAPPSSQPQIVYVLSEAKGGRPKLWRIDGTAARRVTHLPPSVFGHQGWFDMALAVDPADPNHLFFGGSGIETEFGWNAALFSGTVLPAAGNAFKLQGAFIGDGVHADVHAITVSGDGSEVWVGCDGGVFASSAQGAPGSFRARNTGLAITECGYVASHPADPGPVAAGTQDNGVIVRVGDTVWRLLLRGDGGGVQYHPQPGSEPFLAGQYTESDWNGNGRFGGPMATVAGYKKEDKRSSFYSGAAAAPGVGAKARLAIGTYRVWLTEDWEPTAGRGLTSWRTLPSNTDPRGLVLNRRRDELDRTTDEILSVKWLDTGQVGSTGFINAKLLVLYPDAIQRLDQDAAGLWTPTILTGRPRPIVDNQVVGASWSFLPPIGAWSEIAPQGTTGSFYVSTTGFSITHAGTMLETTWMDTLWWYDSATLTFFPTGLRNDPNGTKAPAFAVICDPDTPEIVYVGTALGVWKGTLSQPPAQPPQWVWEVFSFGLPEAVVQDLSIFRSPTAGGLKLLRAALQARGVWEVDISASPDSVGRSFLRVHALDTRLVTPTDLKDLASEIRPAPDLPKSLSPDIAIVETVPLAWKGSPTEADLCELAPDVQPLRSVDQPVDVVLGECLAAVIHSAFVLVHHRHSTPAPAADFKVALLKRRLVPAEGDGAGVPLSANWQNAILALLVGGNSGTLDGGWSRANAPVAINPASAAIDIASSVAIPAAAVDARMPRAAPFALDLAGATAGQRYLLLAVMSSVSDPLIAAELAHSNVGDLVLNCRHACARVVYV